MDGRTYFCAAHVQECVQLCDKAQEVLNADVDSAAVLLRFEGSPYTDVTACKTKTTVITLVVVLFVAAYHCDFFADRGYAFRLLHRASCGGWASPTMRRPEKGRYHNSNKWTTGALTASLAISHFLKLSGRLYRKMLPQHLLAMTFPDRRYQ